MLVMIWTKNTEGVFIIKAVFMSYPRGMANQNDGKEARCAVGMADGFSKPTYWLQDGKIDSYLGEDRYVGSR